MLTHMLEVPDWVGVTPCAQVPLVFADPALDPDPTVWVTLDNVDKHEVAMDKRAAEDRALAYCAECPILGDCRAWAMRVNVFGPAGGLRHWERHGMDEVDEYIEKGTLPNEEDLIAAWLKKEKSMSWIAEHVGVPVRRVARVKSRLAESAEETAAREALEQSGKRWARVSSATIALYDLLVSSGPVQKSKAIEHMVANISDKEAIAATPKTRKYSSREAQIASGAKRFARDVLRYALRDGNITQTGEGDLVILEMNPEIVEPWVQWREATLARSA